ncbi:MAG: hypothetical protein KJ062_15960 [Thermoanaerobaculia bacterium]|nr:hypothetical protein [Thermoanaerobaculia bacterium]
MNAEQLIEAYVADVAAQLPRRQRNDVAFELRALLAEELGARAADTGRPADAEMALALLRGFGRPAEVAARYRPTLTVIDPADGPAFVRASLVGLAVIWVAGLLLQLRVPVQGPGDLLAVLGRWWGGTVLPSFWWPGVLVAGYAAAAWVRRRWPQAAEWKPRDAQLGAANRNALVLAVVGIVSGVVVLVDPRLLIDVLFAGKASPEAYAALAYTEAFRGRQAPWLFIGLLLHAALLVPVIATGRWSPRLRALETALTLALGAVMAWTVLDGPAFRAPAADGAFKLALVGAIAWVFVDLGLRLARRVKPAPGAGTTRA